MGEFHKTTFKMYLPERDVMLCSGQNIFFSVGQTIKFAKIYPGWTFQVTAIQSVVSDEGTFSYTVIVKRIA